MQLVHPDLPVDLRTVPLGQLPRRPPRTDPAARLVPPEHLPDLLLVEGHRGPPFDHLGPEAVLPRPRPREHPGAPRPVGPPQAPPPGGRYPAASVDNLLPRRQLDPEDNGGRRPDAAA